MEAFIQKIRHLMENQNLVFMEESYSCGDQIRAVGVFADGVEKLIADGTEAAEFQGLREGGEEGIVICPMNHENRLVLNKKFPYTAPTAFGRACASIGCGDRLGIAAEGQIDAVKKTSVRPVLAQQSLRELQLTGRSYEDVLDAAAWAVFKTGYKDGYGADGDHLKTAAEVEEALKHGVSMITLDCSLVLNEIAEDEEQRRKIYQSYPEDYRKRLEADYLQGENLRGLFSQKTLEETVLIYQKAVELAEEVYALIKDAGKPIDLEISLDETAHTTSVAAHYFVARELDRSGVKINSMAPRFVGEFQKAVDYIGDTKEFRADLRAHCRIADHFGYKISLHSGSDKFSVFAILAEETGGRFHLKTSGTSWLEAVKVIAGTEPELYRDMHRTAVKGFRQASTYYVVHCDLKKVADLESVSDEHLPDYMIQNDARQLLHITYGAMLKEDEKLKSRIMDALTVHREEYRKAIEAHFSNHLKELGCL